MNPGSSSPRHPTFLVIGVQKAGTTWLYQRLSQHPDIYLPPRKELHYFSRSPKYPSPSFLATPALRDRLTSGEFWDREWQRQFRIYHDAAREFSGEQMLANESWRINYYFGHYDDAWYLSLFRDVDTLASGEVTPSYALLDEEGIAAMKRLLPQVRIVLMLRDPIDRDWSNLRFASRRMNLPLHTRTPEALIQDLQLPYFKQRGNYLGVLQRWGDSFPADRLFVGFYDQISDDPHGLLNRLCGFLGVPELKSWAGFEERVNPTDPAPIPGPVLEHLLETHLPQIEVLAGRFGGYPQRWVEKYRG